jgi:TRAP-type C4-dicarboxylate transport system permease large subunit
VIRAITPYILTNIIVLLMVSYWAPLATWLPNLLMP